MFLFSELNIHLTCSSVSIVNYATVQHLGAPSPWRESAPVSLLHRVEIGRAAAVVPVSPLTPAS